MFIGVSGLIGVGKTTFTEQLAGELGYNPVYEPVTDNPYLEDFYQDIPRWTFPMQMFLLAKRYQQHQEVIWNPCHQNGGGVVQDRTIYEDTIFAKMHHDEGMMDDRDYATYVGHFNIMRRFLQYPDLIVYLYIPPELALERVHQRGREVERGLDLEYLRNLHKGYERFAEEMGRYTVVVRLNWAEFDPIGEVAKYLMDKVDENREFLRSIRRI